MSRLTPHRTGIIGGSGLYHIDGIEVLDTLSIDTPYGAPSDELVLARMGQQEIVFLPRHGRMHSIPPHKINYRANIYAMKLAGVHRLISISAVGSLRKHIHPGEFVLVDQFVDRTHGREGTFFDGPIVAHVSMADPVCNQLREELADACRKADITTHQGGRYLVMQGPQFSSRAESELYRSWGMDVVGMTNLPEAKLAREAELCYATVAMCTDYDCWHGQEEDVTVHSVVEVMQQNVTRAKAMLHAFFNTYQPSGCRCGCREALAQGMFANLAAMDDDAIRPVHALVARLL